ncbi:MAG: aldehyde dehydrogenase family protein [Thermoplasmatota archaeon]
MKMLIGEEWVDKKEKIIVKDPYSHGIVDRVPKGTKEDMKKAIDFAVIGFKISKNMPVHKRIDILMNTAGILKKNQEEFVRIICSERGKTVREARKEVSRAINTITISAEEARRIVGETLPFDSVPGSESRIGYYYRFPIGIIGAITPFNDPLNLVAHKLGPAIAGGNSIVLKPATATPLSALKLGEAFIKAGLPKNILNIVTGYGSEIGDVLVNDDRIRMITFTGGVQAGLNILKHAGLKKISMELGSNSPTIIMDDAEIDKAVDLCIYGGFSSAGQSCIGVQRILVHAKVYDDFASKLINRANKLKVGCQHNEETDMGPMISEKEATRVEQWVDEALNKGAKLLTGEKRNGSIYYPTVLENIPNNVKIDCEEVFGPVVCLYKIKSLDEAIKKANNVRFGLQAGIFTKNIDNAFKAVKELDVGGVIVNDSSDYRIDMMPFGGVKYSGLGREGIKHALMEMTEPKVVCFNL